MAKTAEIKALLQAAASKPSVAPPASAPKSIITPAQAVTPVPAAAIEERSSRKLEEARAQMAAALERGSKEWGRSKIMIVG